MPMISLRRPLLMALSLALAALACAYSDVPLATPNSQQLPTPVEVIVTATGPAPTLPPTDTATAAPTDTPPPPTVVPTTEVPPTAGPPTPTSTLVVQVTTEVPTATTEGEGVTETPTVEAVTAEPSATLDPSVPTPTLGAIPAEATFTRVFTTTADGDFPYGLVRALNDAQVSTWASLRNGRGVWQFELPGQPTVSGVRLYAHRDRNEDTTLLGIDLSLDGVSWITVYDPTTSCGSTPACAVIAQDVNFDIPFGPLPARFLRLRSGPTALALAEVQFALQP